MSSILFLPFHFLARRKNGRNRTRKTQETPGLHKTPNLGKLPLELLQHIASYLNPESAACFTLCSKSLLRAIGNEHWSELRVNDQDGSRQNFLTTLQKDLRQWLFCYHCEKLHPFNLKPDSPTTWRFREEPPCTETDGITYFLPMFGIRFQYAQMIMKLHHLGVNDNIYLNSLSYAKNSFQHPIPYAHTSARIANNNLLVKLEWRILLRQGEDSERVGRLSPDVCSHWRSLLHDDNVLTIVRSQLDRGPNSCSGMRQCQQCWTEFVLACVDCNQAPGGLAVYITAWKDFGPCDTPFDVRWRSQIWPIYNSLPSVAATATFRPGSIQKAFEDIGSSKLEGDELLSKWPLDSDARFHKLVADMEG